MDAADPETFITGVAAVLSCYPDHVVSRVTDPRYGLPGKQAFPPSPFEVREACEAEMAPIRRQIERERRVADTRLMLPPPDEGPRPTLEELQERCGGPSWGISGSNDALKKTLTAQAEKTVAQAQLADWESAGTTIADVSVSPQLSARIAEMVARRPAEIREYEETHRELSDAEVEALRLSREERRKGRAA